MLADPAATEVLERREERGGEQSADSAAVEGQDAEGGRLFRRRVVSETERRSVHDVPAGPGPGWSRPDSDREPIRRPFQTDLGRRGHVTRERRGGHDRRAREIALAADAHAVLPVAVEGGDGALARLQG